MMSSTGNYNPQILRNQFIREIDESQDPTYKAEQLADKLFTLGLTMYSKNFCLDSLIYNSFALSYLDDRVSLHPEQLQIIEYISEEEGVIFSAPTSFGKTFVIFEYIARFQPDNIVLVVPTLALVDEYMKKIIKRYEKIFQNYNIYLSMQEGKNYNFNSKNIFILTHDRVVDKSYYTSFEKIDFLVIDEVYKLQKDLDNDRILILNLAYYYLVQIAKKHVLLAPFIGGVEKLDQLEKRPKFIRSNFSPVVNDVITIEIIDERDRKKKVYEIVKSLNKDEKTLIYFPTVTGIHDFVKDLDEDNVEFEIDTDNPEINEFIQWVNEEIHDDWYLVKAMKNGYLVHNGQLPVGIRLFQLDLYENSKKYNKLLCTSTLLEGVNTSAKNIIITKPARGTKRMDLENFDAFDFYNLVGRSGRLFQHYVGKAYYIKGPNDPHYVKHEAVKNIQFEVTDTSQDMDIHNDNYIKHQNYQLFLNNLGITHKDYKDNIGFRFRFGTIESLYESYKRNKHDLLSELHKQFENTRRGRYPLVRILYKIFEGTDNRLYSNIINKLLYKSRPKLKTVINEVHNYFRNVDLDVIISSAIRLKSSYIEYDFYAKLSVVLYYMRCEKVDERYIQIMETKIKQVIDFLYFMEFNNLRMLKDLGIYENDIQKIVKVIGDDFNDAFELKKRLLLSRHKLQDISIVSRHVINGLSQNN